MNYFSSLDSARIKCLFHEIMNFRKVMRCFYFSESIEDNTENKEINPQRAITTLIN